MQQLIRRLAGRCGPLGAAAALAAVASIVPASPAAATDPQQFVVVNSASYEAPDVPHGLLTIFTSIPVTDLPNQAVPWQQQLSDRLWVSASCNAYDQPKKLPITYIGRSGSGHQINMYLPEVSDTGQWGSCPYSGDARFVVKSGIMNDEDKSEKEYSLTGIRIARAHPGVFFEGDHIPAGDHIPPVASTPRTRLSTCADQLPASPAVCPSAVAGVGARLSLTLTGAEFFVTNPDKIIFELAQVQNGVVSEVYVPQELVSLANAAQGTQSATVRLLSDTEGGEYRLRVRTLEHSQSTQVLKLEFGTPQP